MLDEDEENKDMVINYLYDTKDIVVKISDNLKQVFFSNGIENYILKSNTRGQNNILGIKDKKVRSIVSLDDDFLFTASKEYDRDIDILHTTNQNFDASLKRFIQPGDLRIYDSIITKKDDHKYGILKIVMKVGQEIFVDEVDIDIGFQGDDEKKEIIKTSSGK